MQVTQSQRTSLALTAVVSLITLAALALAATVLAYWTWVWFTPRPEQRSEPAIAAATTATASAQTLFGTAQREREAAAPTSIAIKLHGVVAATRGRRGYAIMQLEGRDIVVVAEGKEVAPGIMVAEVHRDHVILSRNGARESLAWPQKK